ncbi:hypothetical protein C0995_010747 [Termitomyces sp. Mi166|nr:hypothetical protein C0995_010747 [Termitomyces sp. Mi166\
MPTSQEPPPKCAPARGKGKGKAKAMKNDDDDKDEAIKKITTGVRRFCGDWSPDHPSLAWLSFRSSASPSLATLAVSQAAKLYPDTSHQCLLHHLGQLASQPLYVTSTASAKP